MTSYLPVFSCNLYINAFNLLIPNHCSKQLQLIHRTLTLNFSKYIHKYFFIYKSPFKKLLLCSAFVSIDVFFCQIRHKNAKIVSYFVAIKIHLDNIFRTKQTAIQNNLIHAVINNQPNEFEIQHLEKYKVKVL